MATGVLEKEKTKLVTADARGRVALGTEASTQTFTVRHSSNGEYILTPMIHVPARESWLSYENESRASFMRGLADIKEGRVKEVDYSQYLSQEDLAEMEETGKE